MPPDTPSDTDMSLMLQIHSRRLDAVEAALTAMSSLLGSQSRLNQETGVMLTRLVEVLTEVASLQARPNSGQKSAH